MKKLILAIFLIVKSVGLWAYSAEQHLTKQLLLEERLNVATSYADRHKALINLSNHNINQREEVGYQLMILDQANGESRIDHSIKAYGIIMRNYYNRCLSDSLRHYLELIRPLSINNNQFEGYCYGTALMCFTYIKSGDFENALNILCELEILASKTNNLHVEITCKEIMARIDNLAGEIDKSSYYYQKGFTLVPEGLHKNLPPDQKIAQLIELLISNNKTDDALKFIRKFEEYIHTYTDKQEQYLKSIPNLKMCYTYYLYAYIQSDNMEMAASFADKISEIEEVDNWYIEKHSRMARFDYYKRTGQPDKAMNQLDALLETTSSDKSLLHKKAAIYAKTGDVAGSNRILDDIYDIHQKEYEERMSREINYHFINEEITDLEATASRMIVEEKELHFRISMSISIIISITIVFMLAFFIRSRTMKSRLKLYRQELIDDRNRLYKTKIDLERARDKANESNRLKSAFIANMSHEIRTPLNSIVGFSELIADNAMEGSSNMQYTDIIRKNSALLLKLINSILEISRIDSGIMKLDLSMTNISACALKTLNEYKPNMRTGVEGIFHTEPDNILINTDPHYIEKILSILLDNACKFTERGSIKVAVTSNRFGAMISVCDTGCGVPRDKQEHIFERFEKLDEFSQGCGLGLSICRALTERLNGSIYINPGITTGCELFVELPFR